MSDDLVPSVHQLQQARRAAIVSFEALLQQHEGAVCGDSEQFPLVHRFAPGLYCREIFIPKDSLLTGKIHREAHPVFLMQGRIRVYTEQHGMQELEAPLVFIAPAGVKRAALALTDVVWVTVHHNPADTTDLAALEAAVIAPTFEAFAAQLAAGQRALKE